MYDFLIAYYRAIEQLRATCFRFGIVPPSEEVIGEHCARFLGADPVAIVQAMTEEVAGRVALGFVRPFEGLDR